MYICFLLVFFYSFNAQNMGSSMFEFVYFSVLICTFASVFDFGISLATVRELAYPQNTQEEK
jgi:uncharacterized membrane protein